MVTAEKWEFSEIFRSAVFEQLGSIAFRHGTRHCTAAWKKLSPFGHARWPPENFGNDRTVGGLKTNGAWIWILDFSPDIGRITADEDRSDFCSFATWRTKTGGRLITASLTRQARFFNGNRLFSIKKVGIGLSDYFWQVQQWRTETESSFTAASLTWRAWFFDRNRLFGTRQA